MFNFKEQQRLNKLETLLRRLSDLTCPGVPPLDGDVRSRDRQNRSLPALLAPWENGTFLPNECTFAITKDIADHGISLVLPQPLRAVNVVVGFWPVSQHHLPDDSLPFFVVGEIRQNVDIGGGFWQLGLALRSLLSDPLHVDRLRPLAARLIPKVALQRMPVMETLSGAVH